MTCNEFREISDRMIGPLDGTTASERAAAGAHVKGCLPCLERLKKEAAEYIKAKGLTRAEVQTRLAIGASIAVVDAANDDPELRGPRGG